MNFNFEPIFKNHLHVPTWYRDHNINYTRTITITRLGLVIKKSLA